MTTPPNVRIVHIVPRSWLGRLVAAGGTIALILLAVFFFTVFLTVFAVLAVVIIARILWAQHQTSQKTSEHVIDAEYTVDNTEIRQPTKIPPSDSQCVDHRRNEAER